MQLARPCRCKLLSRPRRPFRRRGEVDVEMLLFGVADELPVVGEGAMVAVAEVLEHDLAGFAEAVLPIEKFEEKLSGLPE